MQRLAEIEHRRQALLQELKALDFEEAEVKRAMQVVAVLDPRIVEIVQSSVTQQGCAEAQTFFDTATPHVKSDMFNAMLPDLRLLLTNTYGALFVQKIFDLSDVDHLGKIVHALSVGTVLVDVASSTSGSRALQRLMELLPTPALANQFLLRLCPDVAVLSSDLNACHVVQRALTTRFLADKDRLVAALIANLWQVATNKQGCCVLQRAIDWSSDALRQKLIDAILVKEIELVQDAYGNYVVQHLLDRNEEAISKRAIQQLLHNVAALSCNKFGSNVVEKCVRLASSGVRQLLIDELTDPSVLPRLLQDSYANYVIQTAISTSNDEQFQQLHCAIRPNFASLKNSPYGVRIEAKIQRRLKDNARARQRKSKKNDRSPGADMALQPPQHILAVATAAPVPYFAPTAYQQ